MANEITTSVSIGLTNAAIQVNRTVSSRIDQSTARYAANVQSIETAAESLAIPADIVTPGVTLLNNLGPTNYVEVGIMVSGTFYPVHRLKAGEAQLVRLSTTPLYARANVGSVTLETIVLAD